MTNHHMSYEAQMLAYFRSLKHLPGSEQEVWKMAVLLLDNSK